jgi:hypothetical protein
MVVCDGGQPDREASDLIWEIVQRCEMLELAQVGVDGKPNKHLNQNFNLKYLLFLSFLGKLCNPNQQVNV